MLFKIKMAYGCRSILKNLSKEEYDSLRKIITSLPEKIEDYLLLPFYICDIEGVIRLLYLGIGLEICQIRDISCLMIQKKTEG